jgi:hypothetical protein
MPVRDNSTIAKADDSYADARARRRAPTLDAVSRRTPGPP